MTGGLLGRCDKIDLAGTRAAIGRVRDHVVPRSKCGSPLTRLCFLPCPKDDGPRNHARLLRPAGEKHKATIRSYCSSQKCCQFRHADVLAAATFSKRTSGCGRNGNQSGLAIGSAYHAKGAIPSRAIPDQCLCLMAKVDRGLSLYWQAASAPPSATLVRGRGFKQPLIEERDDILPR